MRSDIRCSNVRTAFVFGCTIWRLDLTGKRTQNFLSLRSSHIENLVQNSEVGFGMAARGLFLKNFACAPFGYVQLFVR